MKHLISIIKFFNKRQLQALLAECVAQYKSYSLCAHQAKRKPEENYFRGYSDAYNHIAGRIRDLIKEDD